jgi:hypothetical protein
MALRMLLSHLVKKVPGELPFSAISFSFVSYLQFLYCNGNEKMGT